MATIGGGESIIAAFRLQDSTTAFGLITDTYYTVPTGQYALVSVNAFEIDGSSSNTTNSRIDIGATTATLSVAGAGSPTDKIEFDSLTDQEDILIYLDQGQTISFVVTNLISGPITASIDVFIKTYVRPN